MWLHVRFQKATLFIMSLSSPNVWAPLLHRHDECNDTQQRVLAFLKPSVQVTQALHVECKRSSAVLGAVSHLLMS